MPAFSSQSNVYEIMGLLPTGNNAFGTLSSSEMGYKLYINVQSVF